MMPTSFLLAVLMVAAVSGCLRKSMDASRITYTVRNRLEGYKPHFDATTLLDRSEDGAFIDYMYQAANMTGNSVFTFTERDFPGMGSYITSINGLEANNTAQVFWAFIKKKNKKECLMPVGVSNYNPRMNDHIVMSFETYGIFQVLTNCKIKESTSEGGH